MPAASAESMPARDQNAWPYGEVSLGAGTCGSACATLPRDRLPDTDFFVVPVFGEFAAARLLALAVGFLETVFRADVVAGFSFTLDVAMTVPLHEN